jgi:hypothetical protein
MSLAAMPRRRGARNPASLESGEVQGAVWRIVRARALVTSSRASVTDSRAETLPSRGEPSTSDDEPREER